MKGMTKSGTKLEVEFNKLGGEHRQLFETLLLEKDVKFQRNKTDGRYVAVLKVDKDAIPSSIARSGQQSDRPSPSPRVKPRINYSCHQGCPDDEIEPKAFSPYRESKHPTRPIKTRVEKMIETARMNSTGPHSHRAINISEGKTVNLGRSLVLEHYKEVFPEVEIDRSLFTPVHVSYPFLVRKIELFYNRLFDSIQRQKSLESVSLSRAISEYYQKEYQASPNYYQQNIVNLLYSGHKQSDRPEINTFMGFLAEKPGSLKLLFYLYVRQFVKIVTGNFLLKLDDQDPSKIIVSRVHAQEVVAQALYFDEGIKAQTMAQLNQQIGSGKGILYYELLELVVGQAGGFEVT